MSWKIPLSKFWLKRKLKCRLSSGHGMRGIGTWNEFKNFNVGQESQHANTHQLTPAE
jgi:hypothetical protein